MEGRKWHGFDEKEPKKLWSIPLTLRNKFQLDFLNKDSKNPYEIYDAPLLPYESKRPLYKHQIEMVRQGITRHYCIFACEMGTGKSLAAIEIMEYSGYDSSDIWFVAPNAGIRAIQKELQKWESKISPLLFTYDGMKKEVANWQENYPAPKIVIFDESSKLKNPNAQRSQAARHLAEAVKNEWKDQGYVIEMSGAPAPKSPVDWWNQCEIACPGFIKEGTIQLFKKRLCLVEMRESMTGGQYPHVITWLDDERKCKTCGKVPEEHREQDHEWQESINEVDFLYKRMKGLVLVQFKKDCLDLPEKQYEEIRIKPNIETLRAARLIQQTSSRAITALTLLRELSDGFQYKSVPVGEETCKNCHGRGKLETFVHVQEESIFHHMRPQNPETLASKKELIICDSCGGKGKIKKYETQAVEIGSPKDDYFIDFLDQHEDVGRCIVWGGFKATIDRLVKIANQQGWVALRVDGRGFQSFNINPAEIDPDVLLDCMDLSSLKYKELLKEFPKVCFVGNPKAGGMAITLTASPTELFYSNSFDGEARFQAEDRFHRAGMDTNRGATIIDLLHLPSDKVVLDNLKKKKKLQSMSMGELEKALRDAENS
jgi:SNF2 family DNA or RNA helicase